MIQYQFIGTMDSMMVEHGLWLHLAFLTGYQDFFLFSFVALSCLWKANLGFHVNPVVYATTLAGEILAHGEMIVLANYTADFIQLELS